LPRKSTPYRAELGVLQLGRYLRGALQTLTRVSGPAELAGPWRCRLVERGIASHSRGERAPRQPSSWQGRVGPVGAQRERTFRQPRGDLGGEVEHGRPCLSMQTDTDGDTDRLAVPGWAHPEDDDDEAQPSGVDNLV